MGLERQLVNGAKGPKTLRRNALDATEQDVAAFESTAANFAKTAERFQKTYVGLLDTVSVDDRLQALKDAPDDLDGIDRIGDVERVPDVPSESSTKKKSDGDSSSDGLRRTSN